MGRVKESDPPRIVDPLPLNCPRCGAKLTYLRHHGTNGVYHCLEDGVVLNPPSGRIYVVTH